MSKQPHPSTLRAHKMGLFAFGSNGVGQLGLSHCEDMDSPTSCADINGVFDRPNGNTITKIVAGGSHTLILDRFGSIYYSGILEPADDSKHTSLIKKKIQMWYTGAKDCSATWQATTILTDDGKLFTYGVGDKGELGRGFDIDSCEQVVDQTPLEIPRLSQHGASCVSLASGLQHTVVVMSTGEVIGWGNGRKGQLGEPAEVVWEPRKIEDIPFKVTRAVCGREFTYLVGDPSQGEHIILGSDKWGVQATATDKIPGWKDIGANWGSIFVLLNDGRLLSWGRNDRDQLADFDLPPIEKIAVGSEHTVALTKSGDVLAWGWGEHGNCGPAMEGVGGLRNFKIIPYFSNEKVCGVGAGCATSWVWTESQDPAPSL